MAFRNTPSENVGVNRTSLRASRAICETRNPFFSSSHAGAYHGAKPAEAVKSNDPMLKSYPASI